MNRSSVTLKVGDQATFKCEGFDQYESPIKTGTVQWSAQGGTIDAQGLFTAGENTGEFEVTAKSGDVEATADVHIQKSVVDPPPPPPPGKKTVRWSGKVPPQKWMNFYTKILSKMAANPDLVLKVSFEIPAEREQSEQIADDAKAGLMDLGLDDDVKVD